MTTARRRSWASAKSAGARFERHIADQIDQENHRG